MRKKNSKTLIWPGEIISRLIQEAIMVSFSDIVSVKISGCSKCFSLLYSLPCQISKDLAKYLEKDFGKTIYPLGSITLLKIERNGFKVEGRLGAKVIKFSMPKRFEKQNIATIKQKADFERCLLKWMENKLNIRISQ